MSQETFERPYITFFNKQFIGQEDEGTVVVLDKFETLNLNPYVVVVEDKSIINIYSLVDPDRHYLFKIEECKRLYISSPFRIPSVRQHCQRKHPNEQREILPPSGVHVFDPE